MRLRSPLVLTVLALGCGSPASQSAPLSNEPARIAPAEPPPTGATPVASEPYVVAPLEVHEWGLIDVYSDGQIELAAGPGTAASRPSPVVPAVRPPMPMRKPVVYFHLDPSADPLHLQVDVQLAGTMMETWPTPTTQTGHDHITWQGTVQHCAEGTPSASQDAAVEAARRHCTTSDRVCEVIDLPTYETSDADCVRVGAQEGRLLFYRGELASGTTFPLTVTGSEVRVTSALPASVLFLREGQGLLLQPSVGIATPLPRDLTGGSGAAVLMAGFTRDLQSQGLSQDEARAFMAAWSDALFGNQASARRESGRDIRAALPPESTLLYFLPRADLERLAPMRITPTPRRLERVMVVRQHLSL